MKLKVKSIHSLQWIAELMEKDSTFLQKKMFGCEALCLDDRQMLVLAAKKEPWNGLLVCTNREHQESLTRDFPSLGPHAVLKKWLYISQTHADFEEVSQKLVKLALRRDPRIGVETQTRKKRDQKKSESPVRSPRKFSIPEKL